MFRSLLMQACEDKLVDKTRVRTWFNNVKISDKAFKEITELLS